MKKIKHYSEVDEEYEDGYLVFEDVDGDKALIYLPPKDQWECGCLVFCNRNGEVYEDFDTDTFINLSNVDLNTTAAFKRSLTNISKKCHACT